MFVYHWRTRYNKNQSILKNKERALTSCTIKYMNFTNIDMGGIEIYEVLFEQHNEFTLRTTLGHACSFLVSSLI